jgi:hypothetical protein
MAAVRLSGVEFNHLIVGLGLREEKCQLGSAISNLQMAGTSTLGILHRILGQEQRIRKRSRSSFCGDL